MVEALVQLEALNRLPAYPASREDYAAWRACADEWFAARRWPTLAFDPSASLTAEETARYATSWRAVLARWSEHLSVAAEDAPRAAHHALQKAHELPPPVLRAAELLTMLSVRAGATSTDVLFLCALFAWPLRDVHAELGELCWQYLIHAPWQSDALNLKDMLVAVDSHGALAHDRRLMDLVDAREAAGLRHSARELLEATVLIQARRQHLDTLLTYRDFTLAPAIRDANLAIVRLAEHYAASGEDQVWAREIMKRAAEITRSSRLVQVIEGRVWDRPIDEAYQWSEQVHHPRQLDDGIARAIAAAQPHHARRLAEAVLVRRLDRVWYGSALERVPVAVEKLTQQLKAGPPQDIVARRAAEHLVVLYTRTRHITPHARGLVFAAASSVAMTGKGAELDGMRDELEWFYNRSDPYRILRVETSLLDHAREALSEDEQRANDQVQEWFAERASQENPHALARFADALTAPARDVAARHVDLVKLEEVFLSAFRTMAEQGRQIAGDLDALNRRAALIRSQYGYGVRLMDHAREAVRFEAVAAGALSSATSFLPPGLSIMAHSADLGTSLLLAFRGVARVGAIFGRSVGEEGHLQFLSDVFALGLSSPSGEGLLTYMHRDEQEIAASIEVGAVAYGTSRLVEYLWTTTGAGTRATDQVLRHLARLCGLELSARAAVRMVPVVGALISGMSTYTFVRVLTEAAIHVAARDALLSRARAYA